MTKPRQIVDTFGTLREPPPALQSLSHLLAKRARIARMEREAEQELGKALAPILRRLKRARKRGQMLHCGGFLSTACGSFNARFFYEQAEALRLAGCVAVD